MKTYSLKELTNKHVGEKGTPARDAFEYELRLDLLGQAIKDARKKVAETGDLSVPLSLRNAPTKLMKDEGYGKGYKYAHSYDGNFADYEFMPEELSNTKFYEPGDNARENEIRKRLKSLWKEKYGY